MTKPLLLLMDHLNTPIGEMLIVADEEGDLRAIDWSDYETRMYRSLRLYNAEHYTLEPTRNPHGLTHAIERYFAGELSALDTLPVKSEGTSFQQSVWTALRTIPCGSTLSYAALAAQIGRPAAVRAVGLANGSNPVGVVVPCHRVIGANGSLTGYGGGIQRKSWLLNTNPAQRQKINAQDFCFDSALTAIAARAGGLPVLAAERIDQSASDNTE